MENEEKLLEDKKLNQQMIDMIIKARKRFTMLGIIFFAIAFITVMVSMIIMVEFGDIFMYFLIGGIIIFVCSLISFLLGIIYGKQKLNNSREAIVKITKILENRK